MLGPKWSADFPGCRCAPNCLFCFRVDFRGGVYLGDGFLGVEKGFMPPVSPADLDFCSVGVVPLSTVVVSLETSIHDLSMGL